MTDQTAIHAFCVTASRRRDPQESHARMPMDGLLGNESSWRKTAKMTRNALHLARVLRAAADCPTKDNDRIARQAGARFGLEAPEYRS